ncbi:MAG: hypothetical protein F7C35_08525 [Desulfurococcales archaeon]|nr:hypothetical protein [Desulfurococcales archaeon]
MGRRSLTNLLGVVVVGFALAVYAISLYISFQGRVVAGIVGASIGTVALIVGADLVRESSS